MLPQYKTCPKCHKKYSYNPDAGKVFCPHCRGTGIVVPECDRKINAGKK